uniref:Acetyl-coenzyme A carboxylase carboxyl transferase subunit beta, chloroplastic n=1 Tax=Cerbera manghas TaxID=141545 RepID=A0A7L8XHI9_9GENT|nr:acetyl-CoA carboxylase carboxyltransferase beta subunit [Cerbera manghas]QOH92360.1 acetyl-CoA carboxylase carboxyltransferase beta subunit [Cerbera manghas]
MERWWFNSMFFKKELERKCGLNKSMDSLGPIENTSEIEDSNREDTTKNIQSWEGPDDSSYSNVDRLFGVKDIWNLIPDDTFLVKDSNGDSYSIYFDIENQIFEIDNNHSFLSELESSFYSYQNSSYLHNGSTSEDTYYNRYMYDTQYSWNNHINSCIDSYLQSQIFIETSMVSDSDNYSDSYIYRLVCGESSNDGEREDSGIRTGAQDSDLTIRESSNDIERESSNDIERESSNDIERESSNDIDVTQKYRHLWVQCENCYGLNYKKFFKSKMNICEECGYHLKMSSSDRIELSIDPGTWHPMDEDMVSLDPIEFDLDEEIEFDLDEEIEFDLDKELAELLQDIEALEYLIAVHSGKEPDKDRIDDPIEVHSEEEPDKDRIDDPIEVHSEEEPDKDRPYKDRIDSYQRETGLTEAVQTGIGQLNGIPVAVGVMDFQFIGGSMGSVVGEKITRLIEYATNKLLPLIIVCASGGARMQEGSLSLMQMAKISSALYDYQSNKKLFYVSILTSPTTGGVTASFGMLGDIIIAEPDATIAFAGKRVIEQTLNITVPEGVQVTEYLFEKGLFDLIVPRNLLKSVLNELFKLHAFFPLNKNSIKTE